jgi:hypothetical protein
LFQSIHFDFLTGLKQAYGYQSVNFEKGNINFDDGEVLADYTELLLI